MVYIAAPKEGGGSGDLFLDLPARGDDEASLILHRGERAFVVMNAFPYTSGHLLVAPYRKTADWNELTAEELAEIQALVGRCIAAIGAAYSPDGFNVGVNLGSAAGAGVPGHIHWHVVPRWSGDANFMTSVGGVRVIPEALDAAYRRLKTEFDRGSGVPPE